MKDHFYPSGNILIRPEIRKKECFALRRWHESRCRQYRRSIIQKQLLGRIHSLCQQTDLKELKRLEIIIDLGLEHYPVMKSITIGLLHSSVTRNKVLLTMHILRFDIDQRAF